MDKYQVLGASEQATHHLVTVLRRAAVGIMFALTLSGLSHAADLEGTWRLVMRKLADGTELRPPMVEGLVTFNKGVEQTIVSWRTPEGRHASLAQIDSIQVSETELVATPVLIIFDDGSGKPPAYTMGGETKRSPITRQAGRMSYQHPTHPPSVVLEGDRFTATLQGVFVDYWEKLK